MTCSNTEGLTYGVVKTEKTGPARSSPHLTELGNKIGLSGINMFDETGMISLQFESMAMTFVSHEPLSLHISAVCYVGELGKKENMRKLLALNFLPGVCRFAIEPNSTRVVSVHVWNTSKISCEEFCTGVEAFLNRTEQGQQLLTTRVCNRLSGYSGYSDIRKNLSVRIVI